MLSSIMMRPCLFEIGDTCLTKPRCWRCIENVSLVTSTAKHVTICRYSAADGAVACEGTEQQVQELTDRWHMLTGLESVVSTHFFFFL
jgi:hypothetical protein